MCRYFKVGREYRLSWSGLWVLILLLSTDVLNISMSILNCPSLSDSSGDKNMVIIHATFILQLLLRVKIYLRSYVHTYNASGIHITLSLAKNLTILKHFIVRN